MYTAAVAPTRPLAVARPLSRRWIRPTGNCRPARAEREMGFFLSPPAPLIPMVPLAPCVREGRRGHAEHLDTCTQAAGPPGFDWAARRRLQTTASCRRRSAARRRHLRGLPHPSSRPHDRPTAVLPPPAAQLTPCVLNTTQAAPPPATGTPCTPCRTGPWHLRSTRGRGRVGRGRGRATGRATGERADAIGATPRKDLPPPSRSPFPDMLAVVIACGKRRGAARRRERGGRAAKSVGPLQLSARAGARSKPLQRRRAGRAGRRGAQNFGLPSD